jgi:hypothetical protein
MYVCILLISCTAFSQQTSCYLKMKQGNAYDIGNYQISRKSCQISSDQRAVEQLRTLTSMGKEFSWVVDKVTLDSYLVDSSCLVSCTSSENTSSRYSALVKNANSAPFLLNNDGLTKDSKENANYLSIDLCPSSKPYERGLFQFISSVYTDKKFPVAVAISGDWMTRHSAELKEILNLQQNGKMEITWVNHTRHHPYTAGLANDHNFLLRDGIDAEKEIIEQEKLMFSQGLQPSIFLRYPGLISNQKLIELTESLGLVPLGSQSWIAKSRNFSVGDILLIHGNGNEVSGINLFYQLVKNNKILNFTWHSLLSWGAANGN